MTTPESDTHEIQVRVRNQLDQPLIGAAIEFYGSGNLVSRIENSDGWTSLDAPLSLGPIKVVAIYNGKRQERTLALDQSLCEFKFHGENLSHGLFRFWHVGLALVLLSLLLVFVFPEPTPLQIRILLGVFSLGGGAFAAEIPGKLQIELTLGQKLGVVAAGALAVFALLYLVAPAALPANSGLNPTD